MVVHIGNLGNCTWLGGWLLKEKRRKQSEVREKEKSVHQAK